MGELERKSQGEEIKVNPETTKEKLMKMTPQERDEFFKGTDFEQHMENLIKKYSGENSKTSHFESLDPDRTDLLLKIRDLSSGALSYLQRKYDTNKEKKAQFLGTKDTFEEADTFENSLNDEQKELLKNRQKEKIDFEGFYNSVLDREAGKQPDKIIDIKK